MIIKTSSNTTLNDTVNYFERKNKSKCCHNIRKYLREHNEVTGIHGLRYLTEKRSRFEKFIWAIIILTSLGGFIYMTLEIIDRYNASPVVVSFATEDTPIFDIPFPTVTICPESKYSMSNFSYTNIYKYILAGETENISVSDNEKFMYLSLLCNQMQFKIYENQKTVDSNFFSIIDKLKIQQNEIFYECFFMGANYSCADLLKPIIIDQGICYSFNILDRKEIFKDHVFHYKDYYEVEGTYNSYNSETGYSTNSDLDTYPKRAFSSGAMHALEIYFSSNASNHDFVCSSFHQGWRVSIHSPYDVPQLSKHYFRVPLDKVVVAAVEPDLITTSENVRAFTPEKRKCFMGNEQPLSHFKVYTQSNCIIECLTNFTLNKCGCVAFHMPRHKSTPVCGAGNQICVSQAEEEAKTINILVDFLKLNNLLCNCKPSCSELKFNVEISQSDFYFKEYFKHNFLEHRSEQTSNAHFSVLSIYLKNEQFMARERNQLYGISDFISNLGGLLGLFTGFSLITMAEIFYFLTLRVFCNVRIFNTWSGPD